MERLHRGRLEGRSHDRAGHYYRRRPVGNIEMEKAIRTIWPFYIAIFVVLMLVTYIPAVSMMLPHPLQ